MAGPPFLHTPPYHGYPNTVKLVSEAAVDTGQNPTVCPVHEPKLIFLYDWQGSWLVQPEITFIRDPFRLSVQYNYLDGQYNGIGFLRDRDNVIIQLEAVI